MELVVCQRPSVTSTEEVAVRPLGVLTVTVSVPDRLVLAQVNPVSGVAFAVCVQSGLNCTENRPVPLIVKRSILPLGHLGEPGLAHAFVSCTVNVDGRETMVPLVVVNATVVPAGNALPLRSVIRKSAVVVAADDCAVVEQVFSGIVLLVIGVSLMIGVREKSGLEVENTKVV